MTQPKTSKGWKRNVTFNDIDHHTQKRTQSILPQFKILESQFGGKEAQQIYTEVEEINNYI